MEEILHDARIRNISFPEFGSLHTPIRSSAHGDHISAAMSNSPLIETALRNMMTDCADWQETWRKATSTSSPDGKTYVEVHAFGPHSPSMLNSSNAGSNTTIEVFDHSRLRSDDANFCPPGAIAIVGMSAEFPGGSNKDALWQALEDGLNMVEEVCICRNVAGDRTETLTYSRRSQATGLRFPIIMPMVEIPWGAVGSVHASAISSRSHGPLTTPFSVFLHGKQNPWIPRYVHYYY